MVYILRTHLNKKYLNKALNSVFGIGPALSTDLCYRLGFQKNFLLKKITDEDIYLITQLVDDLKITVKGDLKRWLSNNIDKLTRLKIYRGIRHKQGLPLRGQRTHTNARTAKKLKFRKI